MIVVVVVVLAIVVFVLGLVIVVAAATDFLFHILWYFFCGSYQLVHEQSTKCHSGILLF